MSVSGKPDIGSLKEFKINVDRWSTYMSRLKAWFTIHDIKAVEQSKYLIAIVGTEALDLIIDLCYTDEPENVAIDKIEKLVEEHLSPKRSVIAERMIFRACKQVDGQNTNEYLVQLKKLSKACKFSSADSLKENLRDQFVYGLLNDRIRQRIMTEKDEDLTFTCESERVGERQITDRIGPLTYYVKYANKYLKKHVDQIRRSNCGANQDVDLYDDGLSRSSSAAVHDKDGEQKDAQYTAGGDGAPGLERETESQPNELISSPPPPAPLAPMPTGKAAVAEGARPKRTHKPV